MASGELIAILNDDDKYFKDHLSLAVSNLNTYGNSLFVGRGEVFGEGPKLKLLKNHVMSSVTMVEDYGRILSLFKINWSISTSSFVFEKELFTKLGGFHGFALCHDLDFLLRALLIEKASVGVSDSPTWFYRCHQHNSGSSINSIKQSSEIVYTLGRLLDPIINEISSDDLLSLIGHGLSPNITLLAARERPWLKEYSSTIDNSIAEWIAFCEGSNLDLLIQQH
jgi:hypothetical protein